MEKSLIRQRKFSGFFWTQFLGAFNDNVFKQSIVFMITFKLAAVLPKEKTDLLVSLGAAVFILPFMLFSNWSATWANQIGKSRVIVYTKRLEILIMILGGAAYLMMDFSNPEPTLYLLLAILFLMGTQSTIFGPAKYSIIPELLEDKELTKGNGLLEMGTFVSILLGTYTGGWLVEWFGDVPHWMAIIFIGVALLGWRTSERIPRTPAVNPQEKMVWFFPGQIWREFWHFRKNKTLYLCILGSSFFWFAGAIFLQIIPGYGQFIGASARQTNFLMIVFSLGIGVGSMLCDRLSDGRMEMGLIPFGAIGMAFFSFDFGFFYPQDVQTWGDMTRVFVDLFGIGMFAGFFIVPLNALMQQRASKQECARVMAMNNILNAVFMVVASIYVIIARSHFGLSEPQLIQILGFLIVLVTIYICVLLPEFLVRFLLWMFVNTLYKVKVLNRDRIPQRGPVLFVANHLSFIDAFLVQLSTHRQIRFIMDPAIYNIPGLHQMFKLMKVIPIYSRYKDPEKYEEAFAKIKEAFDEGKTVCIFPEGQISRTGQLFRFRPGMERILQESSVPVLPIYIHGIWGSLLSFSKGRFFWKKPQRFPYPITLAVGNPMPPETSAFEVRNQVAALGVEAFSEAPKQGDLLHNEFIIEAKSHPSRPCLEDSTGKRADYLDVYIQAKKLAKKIQGTISAQRVGLLIPASVDGVLINLALSMAGKVAVNLNPEFSSEDLKRVLLECEIEKVITSGKSEMQLLSALPCECLTLEELQGPHKSSFGERLIFRLLPTRFHLVHNGLVEDTVSIVYTVGTRSTPKGVLLNHRNITAVMSSLSQSLIVNKKTKLVSNIPFYHAYGLNLSCWLPLLLGIESGFHREPQGYQELGKMVRQIKGTILLGSPDTLSAFAQYRDREDLKSLKYVITGGSSLSDEVVSGLQDRLGLEIYEGYGAAECASLISVNLPVVGSEGMQQKGAKSNSLGRIIPGMAMKILDKGTNQECSVGEPGILWVSGNNVAEGYVDSKEDTLLRDGWFNTEDQVRMDQDGFLYLVPETVDG